MNTNHNQNQNRKGNDANSTNIEDKANVKSTLYRRNKVRRTIMLLGILTIAATFVLSSAFYYAATPDDTDIFAENKNHVISVSKKTLELEAQKYKSTLVASRGGVREKTIKDIFIYNENISMPKEQQAYLHNLCAYYELDYVKTLSVIKHESQFNPNVISESDDYGYMQVNIGNHDELARVLNTKNDPLNPYINMAWGTYSLNLAYDEWADKGITGRELDEYAWSTYNKGLSGFKKTGKAKGYIEKVNNEYDLISPLFK